MQNIAFIDLSIDIWPPRNIYSLLTLISNNTCYSEYIKLYAEQQQETIPGSLTVLLVQFYYNNSYAKNNLMQDIRLHPVIACSMPAVRKILQTMPIKEINITC